jgi:hypothetical protein
MTPEASRPRHFAFLARALALAPLALALAACYGDDDYYCCGDPYDPGPYDPNETYCEAGAEASEIDRGPIRELDSGEGVGGTIEYTGDGEWRVAVTCDLAVNPGAQGQACQWIVVVGALEGSIEEFTPEELELDDVIEWYPGTQGSSVEDAVRLDSVTDYDTDAFTFRASAGAGVWVSATLDGACGAPFLIWLDDGRDTSSSSEMVELTPDEP